MVAIHPSLNRDILTPIMHAKIAQISRTWIASSLISGHLINDPIITYMQATSTPSSFSSTSISIPSSIIQWIISLDQTYTPLTLSQTTDDDDKSISSSKHDTISIPTQAATNTQTNEADIGTFSQKQ
jgi:hypothetical protein